MKSEDKQKSSTIIKNLFIKNYNKTNNKNIVALKMANNNFNNNVSKIINVEDRSKMMKKIVHKIDSLDVSIRLAFDMHRSGYNYNEIALSFNIPLETVRERVQYARKVVRETILENCNDYLSLRSLTV